MKKNYITSANKFIGSNVCNHLKNKGYDGNGIVCENSEVSLLNLEVNIIEIDYRNRKKILIHTDEISKPLNLVTYKWCLTKSMIKWRVNCPN